MPTIKYPKNPNSETAFVEQDDGTKNRAVMVAKQDTSTLELPKNGNSTKGYVTINGKKQRVVLTAEIASGGGGGGGSYTAGNGISIDGNNEISVSSPTLVNKATGTTYPGLPGIGICNDDASMTVLDGVGIGNGVLVETQRTVLKSRSVAIGNYAQAAQKDISGEVSRGGAVAVGYHAWANGDYSIAIGHTVRALAAGAIQIGFSGEITTNSDPNTFKVANANGNFEIMSADGTIPEARLADTTGANTGDVLKLDSNGNALWGLPDYGARVYDFGIGGKTYTLLPITDPTQPSDDTQRITIYMPEELRADWKIAGLSRWEIKNGGTRVDAIPVQAFTMEQQTAIRIFFKTTGTVSQTVNAGTISILLVRR